MIDPTSISFPGLGIGEFTVDKVAFTIGNVSVRWYGVIIALGIVCAFLVAYFHSKADKLVTDDLLDIGIFTVVFGVIGARLYYVVTSASSGRDHYSDFLDVIAVWNGGLAIYGGIIAGALAIYFTCRYKKISWQKLCDMIAPGVMIAQAMGRWGNFFNGEAHGSVVAEGSPLYFLRMGLYEGGKLAYYHPTFLYESLWNLIGFVLIQIFYKKKKFDGQIVLSYFAWYGFGRMFIEALRTDSLYIGHTGIRISQAVGLLCFLIAGGLLIAGWILSKKGKLGVRSTVYLPGAKRLILMEQEHAAAAAGTENHSSRNASGKKTAGIAFPWKKHVSPNEEGMGTDSGKSADPSGKTSIAPEDSPETASEKTDE